MINEGLSEIIGPFPVPSHRDKRERNDDPGQKRRGHRYSVHSSNHTISINYRDRRSVNYLDRSQRHRSRGLPNRLSTLRWRFPLSARQLAVRMEAGNGLTTTLGDPSVGP